MSHSIDDLNRRNITLRTSKTGEIVPEWFSEENVKLINFLESYHDYLDSDQAIGFGSKIKELVFARDAQQTNTDALDQLIGEIGNGLVASSFFKKPRLMARLLGDFYRAKGSFNSARGFFQGFFGEEATIEYPKDKLFIVGESGIGYESQKFLTDAAVFQTFSILIKCGLSTSDYENLYKRFVHPAGFHFAGEVVAQRVGDASVSAFGVDPLEVDSVKLSVLNEVIMGINSTGPDYMTALLDSSNTEPRIMNGIEIQPGAELRMSMDTSILTRPIFNTIDTFSTIPSRTFASFYRNIGEMHRIGSFTFDDSDATVIGAYDGKVERSIYGGKTTSDYRVVDASSYADSNLGYLDSNAYVYAAPFGSEPWDNGSTSLNAIGSSQKTFTWNRSTFGTIPSLGPSVNGVYMQFDWTHPSFDSTAFVNPEHLVGKSMASGNDMSANIPGTLIKGSWFVENHPSACVGDVGLYFFRIDSDAYYYYDSTPGWNGGPASATGTARPMTGAGFPISRLESTRTTSRPDFSMTLELMDQEQFTTYTSDSAF